jgi:hypothetical protein
MLRIVKGALPPCNYYPCNNSHVGPKSGTGNCVKGSRSEGGAAALSKSARERVDNQELLSNSALVKICVGEQVSSMALVNIMGKCLFFYGFGKI